MYIIVGLGNPTKEYENTRHNAGFSAIEAIADKYDIYVSSIQHKAVVGKGYIDGQRVLLAKPQTYMNLSGESVRELVDYYKIDVERELIVLSDDIELPPGYIRVRKKGSAGGHNGLKSIIGHLGTESFLRVRIGVGKKPPMMDLADYVLGRVRPEEAEAFSIGVEHAVEAAALLTKERIEEAMNRFNKKVSNNPL